MSQQSPSLRAGFLLHDISRLRRSVFDHAMKPYGITRAQWWILSSLVNTQPQGVTQSELARLVNISRVAVGQFVDRLEALGYVTRVEDRDDKRIRRVLPTASGEKVVKKMRSVGDSIEVQIHSGFSRKEQAKLETMLRDLKDNLLSIEASFSP